MKKKTLIALLATMAVGVCCSSALASDVSLKLGYNFANESSLSATIIPDSNPDPNSSVPPYTLTVNTGNGGGFVVGADANIDIMNGFGAKASVMADFFNTTITNENPTPREVTINKCTISGDVLVTYDFINMFGLKLGVQAGVAYATTNLVDATLSGSSALPPQEVIDEMKENCGVAGGSLILGAYADYALNDTLNLGIDGYIGVFTFGDVSNALSNYKLNANVSYEVYDNISINAGVTFGNTNFTLGASELENDPSLANDEEDFMFISYDYKQLIPYLSVSYSF